MWLLFRLLWTDFFEVVELYMGDDLPNGWPLRPGYWGERLSSQCLKSSYTEPSESVELHSGWDRVQVILGIWSSNGGH